MGLFDKRKKGEDDYDSPVEQVSLSAARPAGARPSGQVPAQPAAAAKPAAAAPSAASNAAAAQPAAAAVPAAATLQPAAAAPAKHAPELDDDVPEYGIDKAIELMRALPIENVELVVQVVKKTLESLKVQVPVIIKDGGRKLRDIEGRIDVLKKEIHDLEAEIAMRKSEIGTLEADHKETSMVKQRLELAEQLGTSGKVAAPAAPAASGPAASATPAGGVPAPGQRPPSRASDAYSAISVAKPAGTGTTLPPPTGAPASGGSDPNKK
jgi:hypothetical protein